MQKRKKYLGRRLAQNGDQNKDKEGRTRTTEGHHLFHRSNALGVIKGSLLAITWWGEKKLHKNWQWEGTGTVGGGAIPSKTLDGENWGGPELGGGNTDSRVGGTKRCKKGEQG